jgi:hypothetical protein
MKCTTELKLNESYLYLNKKNNSALNYNADKNDISISSQIPEKN